MLTRISHEAFTNISDELKGKRCHLKEKGTRLDYRIIRITGAHIFLKTEAEEENDQLVIPLTRLEKIWCMRAAGIVGIAHIEIALN